MPWSPLKDKDTVGLRKMDVRVDLGARKRMFFDAEPCLEKVEDALHPSNTSLQIFDLVVVGSNYGTSVDYDRITQLLADTLAKKLGQSIDADLPFDWDNPRLGKKKVKRYYDIV